MEYSDYIQDGAKAKKVRFYITLALLEGCAYTKAIQSIYVDIQRTYVLFLVVVQLAYVSFYVTLDHKTSIRTFFLW